MRIRTRSLIIMASQGVIQLSSLILSVVLVRIVSQEVFGSYRQAMLAYMTLSAVLSLQVEQSLYYFVPKYGHEARAGLLSQSFGFSIAIAAMVSLALLLAADDLAALMNNPGLAPAIRMLALLPVADRIGLMVPTFMISVDKAARAAVYSAGGAASRVVVVVLGFSLGAQLEGVILLMVVPAAAWALVGGIDMIHLSRGGSWKIEPAQLREQLLYTLPLWLTSVTGVLNRQYDKLLVSVNFDPSTYAVYFCGAIELPVVQLVTSSIAAALMPNLVALGEEGRTRDMLSLWQEAARKCSLVVFPCFAFFLAIRRDFIVLLYGEDYSLAADPFGIYLLSLPLRVGVYAAIFRATGRTRDVAVGAGLTLAVNVVVSTALVWIGGKSHLAFIGPSIGTVVATLAAVIYLLSRLRSVTQVRLGLLMRWRELGTLLLVCSGVGVLIAWLPVAELGLVARLGIRGICFGGVLAGILLGTSLLSDDERNMLRRPLRIFGRDRRS